MSDSRALTLDEVSSARLRFLAACDDAQREQFLACPVDKQDAIVRESLLDALEVEKRMPPLGAIPGLSRLLDERRLKYGIVARAFTHHRAVFDCVLVYQIPQYEGETYADGKVLMPETAKKREILESARCVIVSAGLKALDELRSHGIDLGHIVHVCKHTPLRQRVDMVNGEAEYLLMIRPGDITDSEDLAQAFITGEVRTVAVDDERTGAKVHQLQIRDEATGEFSPPMKALMPWIPDDT